MKLIAITLLILSAAFCFAQTPALPNDIYAAGASLNSSGSPQVAGSALYAHKLDDLGTYAFSIFDATPNTLKPFTVVTSVGAGVAQKAFTIGKVPVYVPVDAGFAWNGKNAGWAWHGGAMASVKVYDNWRIFPAVRFGGSSVSNGSGVQPIFSLMVGYAK